MLDCDERRQAIKQLVAAMERGCERVVKGRNISYTPDEKSQLRKIIAGANTLEEFAEGIETEGIHLRKLDNLRITDNEENSINKFFRASKLDGYVWKLLEKENTNKSGVARLVFDEGLSYRMGVAYGMAKNELESIPDEALDDVKFLRGFIDSYSYERQEMLKGTDPETIQHVDIQRGWGKLLQLLFDRENLRGENQERGSLLVNCPNGMNRQMGYSGSRG